MPEPEAWIRAETGGTKRALVINKPEVLNALIKKAEHPIFIIGHEAVSSKPEYEVLIHFIKSVTSNLHIPIIATAHIISELLKRGVRPVVSMGAMEITDRLCDPMWKGLDGSGKYDLILIAGIPYALVSVLLSGLKHGAPGSKTIILDRYYHPNAAWSFPNLKINSWREELEKALKLIREDIVV